MVAITDAEAVVLAQTVPVVIGVLYSAWQSRRAAVSAKQTSDQYRPNGGTTARDSLDRIETNVNGLHHRHDQLEANVNGLHHLQHQLSARITAIEEHVTAPRKVRNVETARK